MLVSDGQSPFATFTPGIWNVVFTLKKQGGVSFLFLLSWSKCGSRANVIIWSQNVWFIPFFLTMDMDAHHVRSVALVYLYLEKQAQTSSCSLPCLGSPDNPHPYISTKSKRLAQDVGVWVRPFPLCLENIGRASGVKTLSLTTCSDP